MVYMKYLLSKTGRHPEWQPGIEDVLRAATMAHEVKDVVTPHKRGYYYVIPTSYNIRYLYDLTRVFRANGVILRPHKSHKYQSVVFRVPKRGQQFMKDVIRVNQDIDNFQTILAEHNLKMSKDSALVRKFLAKCQEKEI
ncbi:MAG: hypothetical protein J5620_04620 [Alphaproteobacteria bacterium]|nr:hypothetical protein [Alphaproteobacteria bacterium]